MSDFGKKTTVLVVLAVLLFGALAGVTYCNVNTYDEGEFVMNSLQTVAGVLLAAFGMKLKEFVGLAVILAASLAGAGEVHAEGVISDSAEADRILQEIETRNEANGAIKGCACVGCRTTRLLSRPSGIAHKPQFGSYPNYAVAAKENPKRRAEEQANAVANTLDKPNAEIAKWKAAYDREQARKAKKAAKKANGKTAAVESDSPFMQVGLFGRFTRGQSSSCPNGNCNPQPAVSQPATTTTKEVKAAVAAPAGSTLNDPMRNLTSLEVQLMHGEDENGNLLPPGEAERRLDEFYRGLKGKAVAAALPPAPQAAAAGTFSDRERRIVDRFDGSRRAVLKRLQGDAKLRERFAAEWNARYQEKVNAADWQSILEVILRYLPQVLEILFALLK
jgi:hypothetical protein